MWRILPAIAPLFWLDQGIESVLYLDGVVTVVDALNIQNVPISLSLSLSRHLCVL